MSVYLAKKYPFVKVHAIGPDPLNYAYLRRNLKLNGVTNVTAINTAVSCDGGNKTLYIDASYSAWATGPLLTPIFLRRTLRVEAVASVTLEVLFDKH
jgi:FkbM family methyltransferase